MKILYIKFTNFNKESNGGDIVRSANHKFLENIYGKNNVFDFIVPYYSSKVETLFYTIIGHVGGIKLNTNNKIYSFAKEKKIDAIFFDSSAIGPIKRKIYKDFIVLNFFHNVELIYYKQYFSSQNKIISKFLKLKAVKKNEKRICNNSDYVITLNKRDANELKKLYGREANFQIPILFNDRFIKEKIRCSYDIDLLFIGSDFYGNTQGLFWFIDNCLDRINAKLTVIGGGMEKYKMKYLNKRVEFIGFVNDLDDYIYRCKAVVLPIISGSGMKTKTCEAIMFGKTIFGTKEAFEGYEKIDDNGCFICNTPDEFINSINNFLSETTGFYNENIRNYFLSNFELDLISNNKKKELLALRKK